MKTLVKTASIFLLASPLATSAATIYSQNMGVSPVPTIASTSEFNLNLEIADNFTLNNAAELGSVSWLGTYGSAVGGTGATNRTDNFTVNVFSSVGNLPDSLLYSENIGLANRTDTNVDTGGLNLFSYQINLGSTVALDANTTYWLSIVNDGGTANVNDWRWSGFNELGETSATLINNSGWSSVAGPEYQYELASVPIPAAAWLFGSALAGLFVTRKQALTA